MATQDFDGGRIGQAVTRELGGLSSPAISWKVRSAQDFPNGINDPGTCSPRGALLGGGCRRVDCIYAAKLMMISLSTDTPTVNSGSTERLNTALQTRVDPFYNSSSAITAYSVEARNENALYGIYDVNLSRTAIDFAGLAGPYYAQM
jgi:hypothetical protein